MEFIWNIVKVKSTVTRSTGETVNDLTVSWTMTTTGTTTLSRVFIITVFSTTDIINKSPGTTVILSIWVWWLFSILVVFWISWSWCVWSFWSSSSFRVLGGSSFTVISLNTTPITVFNTPFTKVIFIFNRSTSGTTWVIWKWPTSIRCLVSYNTTPFYNIYIFLI